MNSSPLSLFTHIYILFIYFTQMGLSHCIEIVVFDVHLFYPAVSKAKEQIAQWLSSQPAWVWTPALSFTSSTTLGESLPLQNGYSNSACLTELPRGLNELKHVKCLSGSKQSEGHLKNTVVRGSDPRHSQKFPRNF